MAHSITMRRAGEGDNVLLSELGAETFADTFGPDNTAHDMGLYLGSAFGPDVQAAELADPASTYLIAEIDGQPAGYARLRDVAPPAPLAALRPLEIARLYARAPWIGRGVGAALMLACLDEARARGGDVIWLDVWERNARAIAFYRRWGFVEFGSQGFLLGTDLQRDLLMSRPVSASNARLT
jgi:GNAT superfamily N-acetyltransferase